MCNALFLRWNLARFAVFVLTGFWLLISAYFPVNALITPIAFVAAAVANATAVGGGFLFFPLFTYYFGLGPEQSIKLSLSTQAFGMTSGALSWSRSYIDGRALLLGGGAGAIGVICGTFIWVLPAGQIKPFFGWLSIVIFLVILAEIKLGRDAQRAKVQFQPNPAAAGFALMALLGGLVTAWAAIGIGEFIALYLLLVYRVRFTVAVATGVAVLAVCSVVAFVCHTQLGGIVWQFLLFTVPGVLLGGAAGAKLGKALSPWLARKFSGRVALGGFWADLVSEQGAGLKWLFSMVVLVDGVLILLHHYCW
ncbi:sulfite exporter TauE/SafE family protein [Halioxenophilus aromaticivorans]|uniref:Probable membrane transporter protein n=1 Tax=Halioxenophilus aromaticivorans TaxID=1306992 RepID=A0AAV3U822_9ALTE